MDFRFNIETPRRTVMVSGLDCVKTGDTGTPVEVTFGLHQYLMNVKLEGLFAKMQVHNDRTGRGTR
jgi:hypothetical protein